jgi:hypothetical protein
MHGAIPPFPNTPSWRGAQLKYRSNSTFIRSETWSKKNENILKFKQRKLNVLRSDRGFTRLGEIINKDT